ncbi:MAG: metalloregulator ArsR/SmtB family transcription factor [Anaerolineaceae bacterium]
MYDQDILSELLIFFKALSDENRLKIVGLLAQRPYSVENLADALSLSASTTSHHFSRLSQAGLVKIKVDGHHYYYSLEFDALKQSAQRLLQDDNLPRLSEDLHGDKFEQKVLAAFIDAEGKIKSFPAQDKKFLVILNYVFKAFEPGVKYTEKQMNEILSKYK